MAGTVVASTINNDTGLFSTNNAYLGIAKAWVNFNGGQGNTAGVINGSFNVSSITVNGAGDYTINFTTAMPNANYAVAGTCRYGNSQPAGTMRVISISSVASSLGAAVSTTFVNIVTQYGNTSSALDNSQLVTVMVVGN
jgi:hypothetical protein